MRNGMLIDPADDVVVAIEPIAEGEIVEYVWNGEAVQFPALEDITIHHEVVRRDISTGKPVSKYGQHIGVAACDIKKGAHFMRTTYPATGKIWAEEERQYDILWL